MVDRTQELTLLLRAKIAGQGALDTMSLGLDKVADKAKGIGGAFSGMGNALANGLGNATETLAQGGGLGAAAAGLGVYMAGQLVENFGGQMIEKLASSSLVAAITAPLAALGSAIGGIIAAAIPIGMALLPFLIIGAIVAAIAVLIFNEDIRNKVFAFAGELIGNIVKGLAGLGATLLGFFGGVWKTVSGSIPGFIADIVGFFLSIPSKLINLGTSIVTTIINGLISLPGKIADVVRQAFADLKIDIGPFHIRSTGITIDAPTFSLQGLTPEQAAAYHLTGKVPAIPHAAGGWVGLHGPELGLLGEREPELITPKSQLGGATTVVINIAGQTVAQVLLPLLSAQLADELNAASPSSGAS